MNRLDTVKAIVTRTLTERNPDYAPIGLAHDGYVAALSALLARLRGQDMELAQAAGWLHDVWLHLRAPYTREIAERHAEEGAVLAETLLGQLSLFSSDEIRIICQSIRLHDFTRRTDDPMSEILKDADMLSHYLNASAAGQEREFDPRAAAVLKELGRVEV